MKNKRKGIQNTAYKFQPNLKAKDAKLIGSARGAENAMQPSALYSVGKARSRRLKWYGSTDKKCLGNNQSDKQGQKFTQCLPREGQVQGFGVKGTGEYDAEQCAQTLWCGDMMLKSYV